MVAQRKGPPNIFHDASPSNKSYSHPVCLKRPTGNILNILIKISACIRIRLSLKPGFHKS